MHFFKNRVLAVVLAALCVLTMATLPMVASAEEAELTNVALGKTVDANNAEELGFFSASQLTDGRHGEAFTSDEPLGWHSLTTTAGTTTEDNPMLLAIDLDGYYLVSSVTLIPLRFYDGNSLLPREFDIQVSTDGENWTTVYEATDVTAVWGEGVKVDFAFDAVEATWIRLNITKESDFNGGFTCIGEMEVYGVETAAPETDPPATEAPTETDPATEPETNPATEAETDAPTEGETAAPTETDVETNNAAEGCASVIGASAAILVAAAAALVLKKKD